MSIEFTISLARLSFVFSLVARNAWTVLTDAGQKDLNSSRDSGETLVGMRFEDLDGDLKPERMPKKA